MVMSGRAPSGDWQARADDLHEQGGVPERRAQAVALRERGLSYTDIGDELDIDRGGAARHIRRYREQRDEGTWLAEHGPTLD